MSYEIRRSQLVKRLNQQNVDAVVFVPGANLYYFSGLPLHASERITFAVLTAENQLFLLVPQVEQSQVAEAVESAQLFSYADEEGPTAALRRLREASASLSIVGMEASLMRVFEQDALKMAEFPTLVDYSLQIDAIRMRKDEEEIHQFQQAVKIAEESLEATLPLIRAGVSELDIAAQLEYEMRRRGSDGTPFDTIVASGYRGALPHGRASAKKIEQGELVVIDFGASYQGYVADMTRTIAVGEISSELREIYRAVLTAQTEAVAAVRPGITAQRVDEIARTHIDEQGYGQYFPHRTGHGIGLSVHEAPYIMQNNEQPLQTGMAFTIEPGIYLPGKGGVRIEDNIIVTEDGYRNLMSFSKELITL